MYIDRRFHILVHAFIVLFPAFSIIVHSMSVGKHYVRMSPIKEHPNELLCLEDDTFGHFTVFRLLGALHEETVANALRLFFRPC